MEYVDTETFNRFFYRNELVLRVSEDIKDKDKGKVKIMLRLKLRFSYSNLKYILELTLY